MLLGPALIAAVEASGEQLPVACDPGLAVLVHPVHLQQMVVNFLTNARKYGNGVTGLDVAECGDAVQIRVRDAGAGVPADFRDCLFDRFTRDSTRGLDGRGLGPGPGPVHRPRAGRGQRGLCLVRAGAAAGQHLRAGAGPSGLSRPVMSGTAKTPRPQQ